MLKKQRAEHANEEIDPIGWLRVTHGRSQEERWRLNVEELKRQIKSSSEKFRRLHCLHLIFHAFLRAHTRTTLCEFQHFHLHPSRSDRCHSPIVAWKIRGTSDMITWDSDAPKKILPYSNRLRTIHEKTWLTAHLSTSAKVCGTPRKSSHTIWCERSHQMVWALVSNGVSAHIIWCEMIWKGAWWDLQALEGG